MERAQIKSPVRMVLTSMFCCLVVMAGAILVTSQDCSEVIGTLTAAGPGTGGQNFSFAPTSCRSGEKEGFFGVELRDEAGGRVLLLGRPAEARSVRIVPPGGSEILLRPEDCEVFDLIVRDTETEIQNITLRKGRLSLECALKDGTRVAAHLTFENCGL